MITDLLCHSNKFPHSSFNWVGLDGSQLLTHMLAIARGLTCKRS